MLERLSGKLTDIVRQLGGKAHISEKNIRDAIDEIKLALLEADVNLRVVRRFVNRMVEESVGEKVLRSVDPGQQFVKLVHDKLVQMLGDTRQDLALKGPDTQTTILMCGLQGSGKTTTAAKLALHLKKKGRRPLLVAADLVRPAAVEQLRVLASQVGVDFIGDPAGRDAVAAARAGVEHARRNQLDTVLVDTSGRLQIDEGLMDELLAVRKAVDADEVLLVADAMTGQNAAEIAHAFDEKIGLTGIVLSKLDSDTRGGAALSVRSVTGKAIKFAGVGEHMDNLEPFYPERMASRILGMGDVVTLVERAQATIEAREAEDLAAKLDSRTFTLADFLQQFQRVRKMGSIKSLLEMIPGMSGAGVEDKIDEAGIRRNEAIILSMTAGERGNHRIIGPSRRKRIAKGSGTSVHEVNRLLKQFEKTREMMRKMTRNPNLQREMLSKVTGGQQ
jgi:signal recognition particle subunit SRP54